MSRLRPTGLSLRGKLLALTAGVTFLALAVGFGLLVAADVRMFRGETASSGDQLAALLAEFSVGPLSFADKVGAEEVMARLDSDADLVAAAVYDSEGDLFAAWSRPGTGAHCPVRRVDASPGFAGSRYTAVHDVVYRGRELGAVATLLSTARLDAKIERYVVQALLILAAVLVVFMVVAWRLQRFISGPISRLADTALAVSSSDDLGVRVRHAGSDEIASLYRAFNQMLARLEARQRERDAAVARLRESEAKYRAIVQDQTELVFRTRPDGTLLFVNEAYCRYWGRRYEELVGTSALAAVAGPDRETAQRHLAELQEPGAVVQFSYLAAARDGGERWHECTCRSIADARGEVREIQGVARDVTELRRAEQEKQELSRQLEHSQRLETIGTLAGGIAHDFNNILTPILGCIQLAQMDLGPDSDAAAQLQVASASAQRAKELVQQILTFSRHADHERAPIRVGAVIEEVRQLLDASLPSTVELRSDLDPDCGPVLANASQLHQLLVNLCTNAAQAIGERPGVVEVALDRHTVLRPPRRAGADPEPGPYVRLTVRDDGPGMPLAVRERIFEPFFTTKEPGKGTGLGLSVVHGIVTAHGGHITVDSTPGRGTTFTILLPETRETAREAVPAAEIAAPGGGRVLVVDDEPFIADMARKMLATLGYDVVAVTAPDAALGAFASADGGFDLVITDQTMPGMTGAELAGRLGERQPGVRVVIASGYAREAPEYDLPPTVRLVGILRKPFTLEDLGVTVRRGLEAGRP